MRLPNYPVRLFRLSCGCLASYSMMQTAYVHEVLCRRCGKAVVTQWAYPEKMCGARGSSDSGQLACTLEPGLCGPYHVDEIADVKFTVEDRRLSRSNEGRTGRA